MYFIEKGFQFIKTTVATLGIGGSLIAIIAGAVGGESIFIIGGSLCMANSIFNIIEIGKVNLDIKKQIENLEDSIDLFIEENQKYKQNNTVYAQENIKLKETITESKENIVHLEKIQHEITKTKKNLEKRVLELHGENKELHDNVEKLRRLSQDYISENNNLKENTKQLKLRVKEIENLRDELKDNNDQMELQIAKQAEIIKESKKLIQNLAQFGDSYTAFQKTLSNDLDILSGTSVDLDDTAVVLRKLVEKLQDETFEKFDVDGDGVITKQEFQQGLSSL